MSHSSKPPLDTTRFIARHVAGLCRSGIRDFFELVAKTDEVGADAQADYRKQIDHIKDKHAAVQGKLTAFRAASGQKWENFKGGVEVAWHDLENAFKALKH